MKTYETCEFKLALPTVIKYTDKLTICSRFIPKREYNDIFLISKATLVDKLNRRFVCPLDISCSTYTGSHDFQIDFHYTNQKPLVKGASVTMECLSKNGRKTIVTFQLIDVDHTVLDNIDTTSMDTSEQEYFATHFQAANLQHKLNYKGHTGNIETATREFNSSPISQSIIHPATDIPGLSRYQSALAEEIKCLKSEGGRKYKVTNGTYLGYTNGMSSYLFDLETELYISDDAPITLVVGMDRIPGTVLICEDFQIIIIIEKNIGSTIRAASISVEPWKLLDALNERLNHSIQLHGHMARTLLTEGPALSTTKPIEAIEKGQDAVISRAFTDPVTIVWGPPGTGKSYTMSELAIQYLEKGYTVLIVSHSNVSVDGVANKIYSSLSQKNKPELYSSGQILRYGYIRDEQLSKNDHISSFRFALKKSSHLAKQLDDLQNEYYTLKQAKGIGNQRIVEIHTQIGKIRSMVKAEEQNCISKASIVATTASKLVVDKLFAERTFDVVMFDEISMAYVLQIVCAATFARKHLLCVGDFKQLSPIAQSPASNILREDLFTFLGINVEGKPYYHPWLVMLDTQRRMHPDISKFASRYIYHNLLKDYPGLVQKHQPIVNSKPFSNAPMNYIDLFGTYCAASKNQDNSRYNILSAAICVCTALAAEAEQKEICIIAPYAAQVRLIRAMLQDYREKEPSNIRSATVHQFQGSEGNVVFFDAVESYPGAQAGYLMSKEPDSIMRLINVALTRARGKFITVGNTHFWKNVFEGKQHTFCQLQSHILANGNHVSHQNHKLDSLLKDLHAKEIIRFYTNDDDATNTYAKDLSVAKSKIVISLPSAKIDSTTLSVLLNGIIPAKKRNVRVLIKANEYAALPKELQEFTWGTDDATFPITMVDDKIVWYGMPSAKQLLKTGKTTGCLAVCPANIRINGSYTAEMIKSLTNLEYRSSHKDLIALTDKDRSTQAIIDEKGHGHSGLAAYVEEYIKCPYCKSPLRLTRGKSGKTILYCRNCKTTHLLQVETVNHYLNKHSIRCPQCSSSLQAGLSSKGIYVRCNNNHFITPEHI